jgi:6-phosphogluconolactonase
MNPTLAAFGVGAALSLASVSHAQDPSCWVYFGTSATDDAHRGLYVASLNQATGKLSMALRASDTSNSVFMAFSPDHRRLYSLAEVTRAGHRPSEAIETYAIDLPTGFLSNIGERIVDGSEACHISVDPSGRCILTANYDAHYVEVFPVLADFTAGPRSCLIRHSGSGPDKSRQETAHPHSINVDPSGRFAIVADLGLDRVYVYRLDAATGTLIPNDPPFARVPPGAGPRHFAFHPDGRHAFVINEMGASITAFTWDGEKGVLTPYQTIPILREDYHGGTNTSAEVVVSRDGRFVYGSNRGDDSLVVLRFELASGAMSFVQRMADGVKVPRNYAIDPSGKWLVCANLLANNATVYRIDADTGRLALTQSVAVPEPLCVRFVQK